MSALRRLSQQLPAYARGFQTSCSTNAGNSIKKSGNLTHEEIVFGDGHHGLRPGYHYDYEHGPHYLNPRKVPNFMLKWNVGMKALMATAVSIPFFAVWWQLSKAKGG